MELSVLQEEQKEFQDRNFPNTKNYQCLLGVVEEVGELSHAHLKNEQGIRTNENHLEKIKDAVGDIVIYLAGYCNSNNLDFAECVQVAWSEVKHRDWLKNKVNGTQS